MKKLVIVISSIWLSALFITSCDELDPNAPQACFVVPDEIIAGVPTLFTSACSINGTTFSWNFGDGGTSSDANPSHTYSEE